ncbi:hypothetical protein [Chryseobacterium arthrosphaerae]|uniref:hypothetical protein n=2 Tax=Chryseobacterium arthrosphaerae TaxID=651561 RepID=UPI00241C4FE4|nr:hypothetical protein [Chryseobacterium arthrosphaerae]
MVIFKSIGIFLMSWAFGQSTPDRLLGDGVTRVPVSFEKIKKKQQLIRNFFSEDRLYELQSLTKGDKDYSIPDEKNTWTYDTKEYLYFYKNGNLNLFTNLKGSLNLNPDYNGSRGFYYIQENGEIVVFIYQKKGEWNMKWSYGYNKYFGTLKENRLYMRNNETYAGTKLYRISIYNNTGIGKNHYSASW